MNLNHVADWAYHLARGGAGLDDGGESAFQIAPDLASFSTLFDAAGLMTGVMEDAGGDFIVVSANACAARRHGLTPAELAGRSGRSLGVSEEVINATLGQIRRCNVEGPQRDEFAQRRDGETRHFVTLAMAVPPGRSGRPRQSFLTVDVTALRLAQTEADRQQSLMQAALDAAAIGVWEYDVQTDRLTLGPGCESITGWDEEQISLETYATRVHPDDVARVVEAQDAAERGDNGGRYRVRHRIRTGIGDMRWIESTGRMMFNEDGLAVRAVGAVRDIGEQVAARARQTFLVEELNHRVKNNLAVVDALANFTYRSTPDPAAFQEAFSQRIAALGQAHDLLSANAWRPAELRSLFERALAASVRPVRLEGPADLIKIVPERALTLAILLNELATNAAKHGAFSNEGGTVTLTWEIRGDAVWMEWLERGGPPVVQPTKTGFGARVLRRGAGDRESTTLAFEPEGLRVTMALQRSPAVEF